MKKLLVICCLVMCICAIAFRVFQMKQARNEWVSTREVIEVVVGSGDTLDGYYYQYAPDGIDKRQWRQDVLDLNDMDNCMLYAGDVILVYAQ